MSKSASSRRPVLVILHQERSSPGHVGNALVELGYPVDIRRPRFGDPLPETMDAHAGAIIFGGPMSANDPDDYLRIETDWIGLPLREQRPFLGICLGAQMLARHLGATVAPHPDQQVELGYYPIIQDAPDHFGGRWPSRVFHWHREGFDLPTGAARLASAEGAFQNQAFAYGDHAIGIQFHPEITYALVSRWSGRHEDKLGRNGAQPRADQLNDHMVHAPIVRTWLTNFLLSWLDPRLTR